MNRASAYFQSQCPETTNKNIFYQTLLQKYNDKRQHIFQRSTNTQMVSKGKKNLQINDTVMRKIINELFQTQSSEIQKQCRAHDFHELFQTQNGKRKLRDFIEKQQYYIKESQILKQMEEFAEYGIIRKGFH